jgi:hypothetical protein
MPDHVSAQIDEAAPSKGKEGAPPVTEQQRAAAPAPLLPLRLEADVLVIATQARPHFLCAV